MNRKEQFGKAQIDCDFQKLAKVSFSGYLLLFFGIAFGIGFACLISFCDFFFGFVRFLGFLVSACISTVSLFLMFCTAARSFYFKQLAKSRNYYIVQDELIYDEVYHRAHKKRWIDYGTVCQPYVKSYLIFKTFGVYYISESEYYSWSDRYKTHTAGLRATSIPGDTFYIVTADGKTPLMVYNTKLFEYKE